MNLNQEAVLAYATPSVGPDRSPGIYWVLRSYLIYLCSEHRTVEALMEELSRDYRIIMPPSRLQLIPQRRVKGGPPCVIAWARLARRNPILDNSQLRVLPPERKRWWTWLKIKTSGDLLHHAYLNALSYRKRELLGFYHSARSLNAAHKVLARGLPYAIWTFKAGLRAVGELASLVPGTTIEDPEYASLLTTGRQLLDMAWHAERLLCATLEELNLLLRMSTDEEIRLETLPDWQRLQHRWLWKEGTIRWSWKAGPEWHSFHLLRHLLLETLDQRVREKGISNVDGIRVLQLEKRLDQLLGAIRQVVRRFQEILRVSLREREGSNPLSAYPFEPLIDRLGQLPLDHMKDARPDWMDTPAPVRTVPIPSVAHRLLHGRSSGIVTAVRKEDA